MLMSVNARASQSLPVLGYSAGFIQSPCSRQTMRMRVSAKLHATAAPDAPAPTMSTSTGSAISRPAAARFAYWFLTASTFRRGMAPPPVNCGSWPSHFSAMRSWIRSGLSLSASASRRMASARALDSTSSL